MKLGLIADIHEHVGHLRTALAHSRQEQVDQVVVPGDVFGTGRRIEVSYRLLVAKAVGVWGNHAFSLSVNPSDELCANTSPTTFTNGCSRRRRESGTGRLICRLARNQTAAAS